MVSPTVDRRFGLVGNTPMKAPVTVVATSNITLSGEQTIDGVAVLAINSADAPDRVLCTGQDDPTENGPWDVATGAWSRSPDANGNYDLTRGTTVLVNDGATYSGTYWKLDTTGRITVGTTALAWSQALTASSTLLSFVQTGTGAVMRGAQDKMRDFVCILDFIPVAEHAAIKARTSTYDCHAAIMNAVNSSTSGSSIYFSGPSIYFPPGRYAVNSYLNLKQQVHLFGTSSGQLYDGSAELYFPADSDGIVINHANTTGSTVETTTTAASATIVEGLRLVSAGGSSVNAHGIRCRAQSLLRNCLIYGFPGNGIHMVAAIGGGGALEGNVNTWRIEGGSVVGCKGNGLYVQGADSNAGTCISLNATGNLGWGIYDSSFLGNTYVGCHTEANVLGPYKSDGTNARNTFVNCYSEPGQPPSSITPPAIVIAGLHGAGFDSQSPPFMGGSLSGLYMPGQLALGNLTYLPLNPSGGGPDVIIPDTSGVDGSIYRRLRVPGRIGWTWAGLGSPQHFMFFDRTATTANGYARDLSAMTGAIGLGPYYFGVNQMALRSIGTPPTSTSIASLQGDIYWSTTGTSGGAVGWYCTVAGSPGTWRTFGAISTST